VRLGTLNQNKAGFVSNVTKVLPLLGLAEEIRRSFRGQGGSAETGSKTKNWRESSLIPVKGKVIIMAWYLRKSVRLGPVRFNLSKSGIGTSVGVKGFRVGVRPDGRSYLHAGRYGLYYRQELGRAAPNRPTRPETDHIHSLSPDTIRYESASSLELTSQSKKELISSLNKSYTTTRLDYLCGAIFLILSLILLNQSFALGSIFVFFGTVITVSVGIWESKRRTVTITYELDDATTDLFKQIISAFNNLASNQNIWVLIDSRSIRDLHESKLNAGAAGLVSRSGAQVGEGKPPWLSTNVSVPVLKAKKTALYMMPDGILVYDDKGVGFVEYKDIAVSDNTTRFIEERPPSDATIVGQTWKHPNKNGGPDRRFKDNYEIPICLYGELKITSKSGIFLYLMTSRHESPSKFSYEFGNMLKMIETSEIKKQREKENPEPVSESPRRDLKEKDIAGGDRPTRKISAKAILADIDSGMDSVGLMQKYGLSSSQLAAVYKKLEQAGMMKKH
jgi:Protein of unknown function (DUF4236)